MAVLADKRLLIVSGKGGVGKSTIAAALALDSARRGKKTLVCEVNARERISVFLERPEAGPKITELETNLFAVDVRPPEAMREYALMILRFESIYNAVFENRLVRYFLRFIPSLQELVMLGKILFHLREKNDDGSWKWDRIVIDAPATGHAISFLSVPQVIIDTVPAGPMSKEAEVMRDLLVDERVTAAVLVSLPEELPVNETIELDAALRARVHVRTQAVVLNAFIARRFDDAEVASLSGELAVAAKNHAQRARTSAESKARLEAAIKREVTVVPRLFDDHFSRASIEAVARALAPLTDDVR